MRRPLTYCLSLTLLLAGSALGSQHEKHKQKTLPKRQAKQACAHTQRRAGCPQNVACYAKIPYRYGYRGGWVGGGAPRFCRRRPASPCEGTWGQDYNGICRKRSIFLGWFCKPHYQAGLGSYESEGGPHVPMPPVLKEF
ncbi:hypothetical protein [Planctomycetes bacterium Pan216]